MGYARTQRGARRRVIMKHALRREGLTVKSKITNKKLERLYRRVTGKRPPKY